MQIQLRLVPITDNCGILARTSPTIQIMRLGPRGNTAARGRFGQLRHVINGAFFDSAADWKIERSFTQLTGKNAALVWKNIRSPLEIAPQQGGNHIRRGLDHHPQGVGNNPAVGWK
jgi:hypothetical protein